MFVDTHIPQLLETFPRWLSFIGVLLFFSLALLFLVGVYQKYFSRKRRIERRVVFLFLLSLLLHGLWFAFGDYIDLKFYLPFVGVNYLHWSVQQYEPLLSFKPWQSGQGDFLLYIILMVGFGSGFGFLVFLCTHLYQKFLSKKNKVDRNLLVIALFLFAFFCLWWVIIGRFVITYPAPDFHPGECRGGGICNAI